MHYRADIDGLRAVAVASVVLYHAEFHWLPGGFTGVDVFFVISGYLITRLIAEDVAKDRFALAQFYERRARRILPALFVMLAAASLAAWQWLAPADLMRFGESLAATTVFGSNIYFWRETGYFQAPADAAPLLHTWSLAVEEQFYLLFPLVLMWLLPRSRRWLAIAVWSALAVSLAAAEWGVRTFPTAAFYLGPTRAWELLCGAVLALRLVPPVHSPVLRESLGVIGIASIAAGFLVLSGDSAFPGVNALLPCVGAALVIHSAGQAPTAVSRLLSLRAVVFVGLISYSLYLWHWVFFVFARHLVLRELALVETIGLVIASVVVSVLSWRFVEQPWRRPACEAAVPVYRRPVLVAALAGSVVLAVGGGLLVATEGLPGRLPPDALAYAQGERSIWPRREECDGKLCVVAGDGAARSSVLVWGDSHVASLAPAIVELAQASESRAVVAFKRSCAPLVGYRDYGVGQMDCSEFADAVLEFVARERVSRVVLHARWAWYVEGNRIEEDWAPHIQLAPDEPGPSANAREFSRLLANTAARLQALGAEVDIVTSVPEVGFSAPEVLTRHALAGVALPFIEQDVFERRQARSHAAIEAAARQSSARVVHVYPSLCQQGRCAIAQDARSLYHDDDHLSLEGARVVRQALGPVFEGAALR